MPQPMDVFSLCGKQKAINSKYLRLNYKEIYISTYKVYTGIDRLKHLT